MWRANPDQVLKDFRMTRMTFSVNAASFAANMSIKQTAVDFAQDYLLAAYNSFYVDHGLAGGDTVNEVIELRKQLQELWLPSSNVEVKQYISTAELENFRQVIPY